MVVRRNGNDLGVIGLMDTPRASARSALERLREIGITRMIMISGDNQRVADAVAKQVRLRRGVGRPDAGKQGGGNQEAARNRRRCDGWRWCQRCPSHGQCNSGNRHGRGRIGRSAGNSRRCPDGHDLSYLPFAVELSRQARTIIRQNLFISLGVVVLLVPATILGLGIGPAVAVHEGSTLVVVFNALRLLAYRERRAQSGLPAT